MHDPAPDHLDSDLGKSVLDLELELERLTLPARIGGIAADHRAGGVQRIEQLGRLVEWMNKRGVERIERLDPTEEARLTHFRNLARDGEEDRAAQLRDAERAKAVAALQKREDRKEKKHKAA
jgi:hypothetical protein